MPSNGNRFKKQQSKRRQAWQEASLTAHRYFQKDQLWKCKVFKTTVWFSAFTYNSRTDNLCSSSRITTILLHEKWKAFCIGGAKLTFVLLLETVKAKATVPCGARQAWIAGNNHLSNSDIWFKPLFSVPHKYMFPGFVSVLNMPVTHGVLNCLW